jgi:hypothetical protein
MTEIPAPGPQTIMSGKSFIASVNRVAEYLRQFNRLRDTGGTIHDVHTDPETEAASLTAADLEAVLRRATPVMYPDRDELAFELFAADNRNATPEQIRADFDQLKHGFAEHGATFYVYPLADAAIEQFRKANS